MPGRQPHRGKILIVEGNPLVRGLLARLLGEDYDVETASNGQEAVAGLMPGYYGVVLIGLETAEAAGGQVARAMKRIDLPLVAVLIAESELPEADARLNDFDFQIQKPFCNPDAVEKVVALAVQTHEDRAIAMFS